MSFRRRSKNLDLAHSSALLPAVPDEGRAFVEDQLADPEAREAHEDEVVRYKLVRAITILRHARGWTQTDLARRSKTTQSAISDFEKGVAEPRLETLQRLVRRLGFRLEVQLRHGPLVFFDSWTSRRIPYDSIVLEVFIDDDNARSWYEPAAIAVAATCPPALAAAKVTALEPTDFTATADPDPYLAGLRNDLTGLRNELVGTPA